MRTSGRRDTYGEYGTALILEAQSPQCTVDDHCQCLNGASGSSCTERPLMGNGTLQAAEHCDDANLDDGDGCSAFGEVEPWYDCMGEPSTCQHACQAEEFNDDVYLVRTLPGECMYIEGDCETPGVRSWTHIICQAGQEVAITQMDSSCPEPMECVEDSCEIDEDCPDGSMCLCHWGGRDADSEESCDIAPGVPKTCLPCADFGGPVCAFFDQPGSGMSFARLCEAHGRRYILNGECPLD